MIQHNNVFPSINLTIESWKKKRTILYLDILVDQNLDNSWQYLVDNIWTENYHKPSTHLAVIHVKSISPWQYTVNTILPLIQRAYTHSSFEIPKQKELNQIKTAMMKQGYTNKEFLHLKLKIKKPALALS